MTSGGPRARFPQEDHALSAPRPSLPRIESYLTGKARAAWPAALVVRVMNADGDEDFILQRPGRDDLVLGPTFAEARRALYAARDHEKAGGRLPG